MRVLPTECFTMKLCVRTAAGMILLASFLPAAEEIDHAKMDEEALKATAVQFFLNLVEENGKDVTQQFEMTEAMLSWMQEEQSIATVHDVLRPFGRIGELQKQEIMQSPGYLSVELFYSGTKRPFKARVTFQGNQIAGIHVFPLKTWNVLKNMSVMESIFWGIILIPMLIMSLYLLSGKGAFLIAGYNTMSRKERAKYDEKAWCRCTGKIVLWITCCLMLLPFATHIATHSGDMWMFFVVTGIIMVSAIVAMIYVGTGKRFLKKGDAEEWVAEETEEEKALHAKLDAKREKIGLWVIGWSIFITFATIFAVLVLLVYGEMEPDVTITDNGIRISGAYGVKMDFAEITDIALMEDAVRSIGLTRRTFGHGTSSALKGHFESSRYGGVLLFTRPSSSPTIHIQRESKEDVFLNFKNPDATRKLYRDMKTALAR